MLTFVWVVALIIVGVTKVFAKKKHDNELVIIT